MLTGAALRAEIQRICALSYVMPPPPPPPEPRTVAEASDAASLRRRISNQRAADARKAAGLSNRAKALACRPKDTLCREEVCRAAGRSSCWFDRRAKIAGITPTRINGFCWFTKADLKKAGLL